MKISHKHMQRTIPAMFSSLPPCKCQRFVLYRSQHHLFSFVEFEQCSFSSLNSTQLDTPLPLDPRGVDTSEGKTRSRPLLGLVTLHLSAIGLFGGLQKQQSIKDGEKGNTFSRPTRDDTMVRIVGSSCARVSHREACLSSLPGCRESGR